MLTVKQKSEVRGMSDQMQVYLHNECKKMIREGKDLMNRPLTEIQRENTLDLIDFLQTVFAKASLIQYKRQYN